MGKTPHTERADSRVTLQAVKANRRKRKSLTLGELIVCIYDVRGPRKAPGMVRLAMKANLIGLRSSRKRRSHPSIGDGPQEIDK